MTDSSRILFAASLSLLLVSEASLASPVYVWRDYAPGIIASDSSPIAGGGSGDSESDGSKEEDEPIDPTAWEDYADAHYATYTDWNSLNWQGRGASDFPDEPYPLTEITGSINFQSNGLVDMGGFRYVTKVATLDLRNNTLTNLDGLSGLVEAGTIYVNNNQIANVDGLSNLQTVQDLHLTNTPVTNINGLLSLTSAQDLFLNNTQITSVFGLSNLVSVRDLHLNNNNLSDITGLSSLTSARNVYLNNSSITNLSGLENIDASGTIKMDSWYNGPKLSSSTLFCSENDPSQFDGASWSQLCDASPPS